MITRRRRKVRPAFTLVEMLVAMAVTLLMMAALARAFGFVGARIRDSRGEVELSSKLRDLTTLLSGELERCTVTLEPAKNSERPLGYFLYYEGPTTDATSSLFGARTDSDGNLALDDVRYGDFDDYVAFTAVAEGDSWFYGKVPRFVLDRKTAEVLANDADPSNDRPYPNGSLINGTPPYPADQTTPIMIRSKYAEIIYFASPEYLPDDNNSMTNPPADLGYIDVDGDGPNGLPDRIRIHRRVLLIRPDLNLTSSGRLQGGLYDIDPDPMNTLNQRFLQADTWPIGSTTTLNTSGNAVNADSWLFGMASVHQQCDLSVRRVLSTVTGNPGLAVAANSLADLSEPHNRFAHVRVPGTQFGLGGTVSSMPVLALGQMPSILNAQTATNVVDIAPPSNSPSVAAPVVRPAFLSGFLRPEFVLGEDFVHHDSNTTDTSPQNNFNDGWGRERRGEDVLTNNAVGFDVQIFDPGASYFTTSKPLVVGPGDAGYREAYREKLTDLAAMPTPTIRQLTRGGFVDLCYPVLAGGSLRGWQPRRDDRRDATDDAGIATTNGYLITPFSGLRAYGGTNPVTSYQRSFFRSGRLVVDGSNRIRLFQPTFDTFTSSYERDGFRQDFRRTGTAPNFNYRGTVWNESPATSIDLGSDGLDTNGLFGADDEDEREVLPPFPIRPEAIRITVRLENPSTRQIRQSSVVHRDQL